MPSFHIESLELQHRNMHAPQLLQSQQSYFSVSVRLQVTERHTTVTRISILLPTAWRHKFEACDTT